MLKGENLPLKENSPPICLFVPPLLSIICPFGLLSFPETHHPWWWARKGFTDTAKII